MQPSQIVVRPDDENWPQNGAISVHKLKAWYTVDDGEILHDISFDVNPGERIAIGACSSITLG